MSRHITTKGFNVSKNQISTEWAPDRIETVTVPSSSQVGFGGYFTIDYKTLDVELLDLCLQFNFSALTGTTSTHFVPSWFFATRIEYVQNGKVVENYWPVEQFLRNQLYVEDEDRVFLNIGAGAYQSTAQRIAMASTANSYYLPLRGLFKQGCSIPLLDVSHNIQLRVYMDSLVNITAPAGAPVCTFNSCNLLAKIVRLRTNEAEMRKSEIAKRPMHIKFSENRQMTTTIQAGVNSSSVVLTGLNGRFSHITFVVRPSGSINNDNCYQFTALSSFAILDNASANIVGGQVISNSQACTQLNREWTLSTYASENALSYGTDNKANVYTFAFCSDPIEAILEGKSSGMHKFIGSEQLVLNFASTLGAAVQVDIYGYNEAVLEIGKNFVEKRDFGL
jgi:hypothetical protein